MGANSAIEWTTHTFNPWIGCMKISAGCANCYAEALDRRWGHSNWGPAKTTERRRTSASYWRQPLAWNKAAAGAAARPRVFCASMADVFEDHPDVHEWRADLRALIDDTPNLDWLLLTKRPQNVMEMIGDWSYPHVGIPSNVWIGTSVEDQAAADERIPHLLQVPARVRFLSCEPLLGPVDLGAIPYQGDVPYRLDVLRGRYYQHRRESSTDFAFGLSPLRPINWVIVGGESGHGARPMHPDWARSLRNQCQAAGVAFHFKQWGEHTPYYESIDPTTGVLFMAEYPGGTVKRVGKGKAGRVLDGRTWDEVPA